MPRYRPGPGRPAKGVRRTVTTRLPVDVDQRVIEEAEALGISKSELVAALVARQLGFPVDLPVHPRHDQPTLDTLSA